MDTKNILNKPVTYLQLVDLPADALSEFANFGRLGIMTGGLSSMHPQRREEIAAPDMKIIVANTLSSCCTGAMMGILL